MADSSKYRTKIKRGSVRAYDEILYQVKRWWGWKTVGWDYVDFDAALAENQRRIVQLSKRLGNLAEKVHTTDSRIF